MEVAQQPALSCGSFRTSAYFAASSFQKFRRLALPLGNRHCRVGVAAGVGGVVGACALRMVASREPGQTVLNRDPRPALWEPRRCFAWLSFWDTSGQGAMSDALGSSQACAGNDGRLVKGREADASDSPLLTEHP